MSRTFIRQDIQIRRSDTYDDTVAPSLASYETNPTHIEDDLNNIRSMLSYLKDIQAGNWYDVQTAPSTLEAGTLRGVDDLNDALHLVEKKRILRNVYSLVDVTVPATQNWVILGTGELPSNTTAAVGAVSTLGTVVADNSGGFGAHSLAEVAGTTAISPKNLMVIVDGSTRDPILSSNRQVYGLLQSENSSDGFTITDTTPNRVQISFVRINATGDDLEAVPVADIENAVINYGSRERVRLEDLTEADFLSGAIVDIPAAGSTTRQDVYDNQGTTAVETTTNSTLDLNAAGIYWEIRDLANATLFRITEGSTGGTTTVALGTDVDTFDVDAILNNFNSGISAGTGGTRPIDVAVNDGVIETTAGDMEVRAFAELYFDDANQTGSTWAQTAGIKLSDTTAEWDLFETLFGEVSILNAISQAKKAENRTKGVAVVTAATISADTNVTGAGMTPNIDAQLPAFDHVTSFQDDVDVFVNGVLMRGDNDTGGANNHDVYPGDAPATGDLKFEFLLRGTGSSADVITSIVYGEP
jgi:hypothetical protein